MAETRERNTETASIHGRKRKSFQCCSSLDYYYCEVHKSGAHKSIQPIDMAAPSLSFLFVISECLSFFAMANTANIRIKTLERQERVRAKKGSNQIKKVFFFFLFAAYFEWTIFLLFSILLVPVYFVLANWHKYMYVESCALCTFHGYWWQI